MGAAVVDKREAKRLAHKIVAIEIDQFRDNNEMWIDDFIQLRFTRAATSHPMTVYTPLPNGEI